MTRGAVSPAAATTFACIALASLSPSQERATDDWPAAVAKACEHRRYGVRRAASNKIARAGDAAVSALRAYQAAKGRNSIPMLIVDGIARSGKGGAATVALLREWAGDRQFYWRSQALSGLANRAVAESRVLFARALEDPSHLFRIAGARGLYELVGPDHPVANMARQLMRDDPDPRARVRLAAFLLERGEALAAPTLIAALSRDADFVGDPWGKRLRQTALAALEKAGGKDFGWQNGESVAANADAIARMRAHFKPSVEAWHEPPTVPERDDWVGGVEIRSCRNGDMFIRWTEAGQLGFGLDPVETVALSADSLAAIEESWQKLPKSTAIVGRVVCDFVQIGHPGANMRRKFAPGALTDGAASWLKAIVAALESSQRRDLADAVRGRLDQFTDAQGK